MRTIYSSFLRATLFGLAILLLLGVGSDLRPAAATTGAVHVYYLFDPSSPDQVLRLRQLQARASGATDVEVTGLSRTAPVPVGMRAVVVDRFLAGSLAETKTKRWLYARLQDAGDALRVEGADAVLASDTNLGVEVTARRAGFAFLTTTDIGFSTWGKVKDLFR